MNDKQELDKIKQRIRALQDKTLENGCTEAEAMAAAEMIGRLLEKYDLELGEIGMKEEAAAAQSNEVFAADDFAGTMVTGIKIFCGLIAYKKTGGGTGHGCVFVLFGLPQDLEVAKYLYEICCEAMEN